MLRRVFQSIRGRRLWTDGAHLVVGVSGGADSVALLHALHHWQRRHPLALTVAHLHHGIRGRAADEDRDFVRQLAWKLGAPCVDDETDVPALARRTGLSLEMAARTARHEFFRRVAREAGAQAVALAHTADDAAETLLLRLLRGAGTRGLGGIAPAAQLGDLRIVRPLLDVPRADIEAFLRAHGIRWREDATNRDTDILRNRVRHVLLPLLEKEFQPSIRGVLSRTAGILREENEALESLSAPLFTRATDAAGRLRAAPLARAPTAVRRRVLADWLRANGVPESRVDLDALLRVDALLAGSTRADIAGGSAAVRVGDWIELRTVAPDRPVVPVQLALPVPGRVGWGVGRCEISATRASGVLHPPPGHVGDIPAVASIRRPRAGESLSVRNCWPGARMAPLGLAGSIKLQDLFVDQKIPRARRPLVPLVVCGEEVVWVPGYRVARAWAVPSARAPSVHLRVGPLY
ncbi:MAG TPA: tRNA lysidine(34) synthetase TilS [Kiritimatiellia bacterium]|nr:tRNA lysidine(34) synthetase TilS [Kiritimatiellia bacterium]